MPCHIQNKIDSLLQHFFQSNGIIGELLDSIGEQFICHLIETLIERGA